MTTEPRSLADVQSLLENLPADEEQAIEVIERVCVFFYLHPERCLGAPEVPAVRALLASPPIDDQAFATELLDVFEASARGIVPGTEPKPDAARANQPRPNVVHYRNRAARAVTTSDHEEEATLVAALAQRSFGPSKSLGVLVDHLRQFAHPDASDLADGLWRRRHYRGLEPLDRSLPVGVRIEEFAFAAEDAFGAVDETLSKRQMGQLVQMAGDLCGLDDAHDWAEAAEGLTDANFHALAKVVAVKARRLGADVDCA